MNFKDYLIKKLSSNKIYAYLAKLETTLNQTMTDGIIHSLNPVTWHKNKKAIYYTSFRYEAETHPSTLI